MPRNLSQTARIFFNYETLVPFLIGSIFLSVLGNAVSQMLTNWWGTGTPVALGIAVGALAILVLAVWFLSRAVERMVLNPPDDFRQRRPAKRKGLILMISRSEPSRKAIEFHQGALESCWLICSTRTLDVARQLVAEFPQVRFPEPQVINNVNDPLEFQACVEKIYAALPDGWTQDDLIADYVGMTAHGSVGMALACVARRRPLQYTPALFNDRLQPIEALDPIEILLEARLTP